jgi:quercetin dioxygenase-like cupin family protein/type 1 glutamine amidotransferase
MKRLFHSGIVGLLSRKPRIRGRLLRWVIVAGLAGIATPLVAQPTIVLIGGKKQGYPAGEHDFPDGVLTLERLIKASPAFTSANVLVKSFPVGFPKNLAEIDDASVIVLYDGLVDNSGEQVNPLQDPAVKQEVGKLMARGVGLVALHQSLALPNRNSGLPLVSWLGVARVENDRSTEIVPVTVASASHPIARGVKAFDYHDEFYSKMETAGSSVTPILSAKVHTQFRGPKGVFEDPAKTVPIAWAHERPDGGRAFAFSGMHYLATLDDPQVRKLLLNAILWTAHVEVPSDGATANIAVLGKDGRLTSDPPQTTRNLLPIDEVKKEDQSWGELEWFASRALGNSTHMTVGQATIRPGQSNPAHWHPNCDEILHVVSGHIMNRMGDKEFEMKAGDTVVIPEGVIHNARNIGTEDAVLSISYNSADRVAIGE